MIVKATPFLQPLIWTIALVCLFFLDRNSPGNSLCLFRFAGFENCPGCGLGHSISEALHFNFSRSFQSHVLGLPAALIIIFYIIRTILSSIKQAIHGPETAYDVTRPAA